LQQLVCIALLSRRRRSLAWLPSFEEIHGHLQKLLPSTTRDLDDSAAEDGCEALKEASFEGVSSARLQLEAGIHWEALVKLSGLAEGEEGTLAMRFWEPPWANRVGQLDMTQATLSTPGAKRDLISSPVALSAKHFLEFMVSFKREHEQSFHDTAELMLLRGRRQ